MRVIHGKDATYYTQRNNLIDPSISCGTTAAVNALSALGIPMPKGDGQPEDRLIEFIREDNECLALWETMDPEHEYQPNQWQAVLAHGIGRWIGRPWQARFDERAKASHILDHLLSGGAALMTGTFPTVMGSIVHTVAVIGAEYDEHTRIVDRWYIRDSWGDHRTLYRDRYGAFVDLMAEEFRALLNESNSDRKWAVLINGRL